jgi:hypothetical protein
MPIIQSTAGSFPSVRQTGGGPVNNPAGTFGEATFSELNPVYYQLLKLGRVYTLATANVATVTAFTGGAAGTPLLGIFNPQNSGVDLVLLQSGVTVRTTGTTAGAMGLNFWMVNQGSVTPTGTQTIARNVYSQATSGSVTYCMSNTANTGAVASNFVRASHSMGNVTTTAGVNIVTLTEDLRGSLVVAPGNYLAWGNYVAMAVAAIDFNLMWAEIPA